LFHWNIDVIEKEKREKRTYSTEEGNINTQMWRQMFKVEKGVEVRNSICWLLAELDFHTTITTKFVIFQKIRNLS
jgi:hypothetical protein